MTAHAVPAAALIAALLMQARMAAPPPMAAGARVSSDRHDHNHLVAQSARQDYGRTPMDTAFLAAVRDAGPDYLEAERQLLQGGLPAQAVLHGQLDHVDPIARMIARQLLNRIEGRAPEIETALAYLDGLPAFVERTPLPAPPPSGVANYLTEHFQGRVADFLALRLVKETHAPHWRVMALLLYLRQQARISTTEALVRFAADTDNAEWRETAIAAILAIVDPALPAKLQAESERQQRRGRELHQALSRLADD